MSTPLSESDVMRQISDFLDVKMASGSLYWDRLNSGNAYVGNIYGENKWKISLCRKGTADIIVLKGIPFPMALRPEEVPAVICQVIYLEVKGPKGKQSQEQFEFETLVKEQGAEYYVVRSLEEVMEIIG